MEFFFFQNNAKSLDSSYMVTLDLWDCSGRVKMQKSHWIDLVINSHSREGKTLSYSRINIVILWLYQLWLYLGSLESIFSNHTTS